MNILITCAGRRNYLVRYFKEILKNTGKVIAVDSQLSAPALVDADIALKVPSIYEPDYIETIKKTINDYEVKALFSVNDLELPILSKYRKELEFHGANVIISSEEIIDICLDKWKTFIFFNSMGVLTPRTYLTLEDVRKALLLKEVCFPLIVKPRWGSASIGVDVVENEEELILAFKMQHIKIKRSILNTISSQNSEESIVIQEKVDGDEYGMDILNDFNGNFYGAFVRKKLAMRCGETDKAISVIDSKFTNMAKKIALKTKHIGNMDCDFFVRGDKIYFLEMNPRFGGGYPFSHKAGINTPGIYISWLNNEKNVDGYNKYKAGVSYSKYDQLMMIPNESFSEVDLSTSLLQP